MGMKESLRWTRLIENQETRRAELIWRDLNSEIEAGASIDAKNHSDKDGDDSQLGCSGLALVAPGTQRLSRIDSATA